MQTMQTMLEIFNHMIELRAFGDGSRQPEQSFADLIIIGGLLFGIPAILTMTRQQPIAGIIFVFMLTAGLMTIVSVAG